MPSASLYKKAERELDAGRPGKAMALCEKALADEGDDLAWLALAAEAAADLGRWEAAGEYARAALRQDAAWSTGLLIQGMAAFHQGKPKEARTALQKAWREDPGLVEAGFLLAVLEDYAGRRKQADALLHQLHEADADFTAPFHLTTAELDDLLLETVAGFDEETAATLDESRFRIVPMPTAADIEAGVALDAPGRLEGLDPEGDPPSLFLTLYQRNIERGARSRAELGKRLEGALEEALTALSQAVEESLEH